MEKALAVQARGSKFGSSEPKKPGMEVIPGTLVLGSGRSETPEAEWPAIPAKSSGLQAH